MKKEEYNYQSLKSKDIWNKKVTTENESSFLLNRKCSYSSETVEQAYENLPRQQINQRYDT